MEQQDEVQQEEGIAPDTIELKDDEPITFSDNPDGTPAAGVEDPEAEGEAAAEGEEGDGEAAAGEEAAGGEEGAAEQEEGGEQPKRRNKKDFQARINELIRGKHEAEERAAAEATRREEAERRYQEAQQKFQAHTTEQLDKREEELQAKKKQALQDADLEAYDEVSTELMEIRLAKQSTAPVEKPAETPAEAEPSAEPAPAKPAPDSRHSSAEAWLSRNEWYQQSGNEHLAAEVQRLETRLRQQEGYQLGEDLYKRIDEEIEKLPEFDAVRKPKGGSAEQTRQPRSVVAPPSRGGEPPAKPRPGALTDYDKRTMRTYKLDPNNAKHRETYLQYKSK